MVFKKLIFSFFSSLLIFESLFNSHIFHNGIDKREINQIENWIIAKTKAAFLHPFKLVKNIAQIKGEIEAPTPQKAWSQLRWIDL